MSGTPDTHGDPPSDRRCSAACPPGAAERDSCAVGNVCKADGRVECTLDKDSLPANINHVLCMSITIYIKGDTTTDTQLSRHDMSRTTAIVSQCHPPFARPRGAASPPDAAGPDALDEAEFVIRIQWFTDA